MDYRFLSYKYNLIINKMNNYNNNYKQVKLIKIIINKKIH